MKREFAIHVRKRADKLVRGKWTYYEERREVRVLARAEGYAMVRIKGCATFAVPEKELQPMSAALESPSPGIEPSNEGSGSQASRSPDQL